MVIFVQHLWENNKTASVISAQSTLQITVWNMSYKDIKDIVLDFQNFNKTFSGSVFFPLLPFFYIMRKTKQQLLTVSIWDTDLKVFRMCQRYSPTENYHHTLPQWTLKKRLHALKPPSQAYWDAVWQFAYNMSNKGVPPVKHLEASLKMYNSGIISRIDNKHRL